MRVRGPFGIVGGALLIGVAVAPAQAQTSADNHALRWDPTLDVTVTASGVALSLASEVFKADLAPARCRLCNPDAVDARVRDQLVWRDTGAADTISNVTGFVLMPLASVGLNAVSAAHEGVSRNIAEDALLVAEAWVIAATVTDLTKLLVGRERPFVHALPAGQKGLTPRPSDNNLSFFSGHTSGVFALLAASGTIGTMRGYAWTPFVWSLGGAVAATTAYLRIAADKHWLTDVLTGALVGVGIGFAVPHIFHSAVDDPPRASVSTALRAPALPAATTMVFEW